MAGVVAGGDGDAGVGVGGGGGGGGGGRGGGDGGGAGVGGACGGGGVVLVLGSTVSSGMPNQATYRRYVVVSPEHIRTKEASSDSDPQSCVPHGFWFQIPDRAIGSTSNTPPNDVGNYPGAGVTPQGGNPSQRKLCLLLRRIQLNFLAGPVTLQVSEHWRI